MGKYGTRPMSKVWGVNLQADTLFIGYVLYLSIWADTDVRPVMKTTIQSVRIQLLSLFTHCHFQSVFHLDTIHNNT